MFEEYNICPYTGLRSFTEDESLYFKGREENIEQAIEQLQRNKFLMLTGASGDGKSSLVYAGIIPNARAGFLKSRYTLWSVADFRPERNPFKNLCQAVAAQLDIPNVHTVESELRHGFSALVDLYRNSKRYVDTESQEWQQAGEAEKKQNLREAGNLMILVDQFEEFFTNPENYHNGAPSTEANLVLNLLLETARIAYDEDLPIYVVFTMRSDFIGQCAAFRGLPEYIGFSQFFVPRLNRTQLQQVIEEPAVLSGNRITRRLTERLIHDLTEGVDQLPILQHALNQIWHAAGHGSEEMDLIHYAMVGGMPVEELPDDQMDRCRKWFSELPAEIRECYHEPGLQNVLDTHTNKLYQEAAAYYRKKTGQSVSDEDVSQVIKTAFTCLTKIDQSRAVRNRMTLQEITDILNRPGVDVKKVGIILNIFREPGNTFIRPFIPEDSEGDELDAGDVLDITHESLIRNWRYLEDWANEEFDNYAIFLDFEKQLDRWLENDQSGGFLLSIGPLTFFESWYERVQPNAFWIARYLPEELEKDTKLEKARQILAHMQEFLRQSARKHVITRTLMRYGARRVAVVLGTVALVIAGIFLVRDYYQKQNGYILRSIQAETTELVNRRSLGLFFAALLVTDQMRHDMQTITGVVDGIDDRNRKIRVSTAVASKLILQGRYEPASEILEALTIASELLDEIRPEELDAEGLSDGLQLIHDLSVTLGLAYYRNQDERIGALVQSNAERSAVWGRHVLQRQPAGFLDVQHLNLALENALNYKIFDEQDIREILKEISPFENDNSSAWLQDSYQLDKLLVRGSQPIYGIRYNGLFQMLGYFYGALGDAEMAVQSVDSVLRYQGAFYENNYMTHVDNATHVAALFYTYGRDEALNAFIRRISQRVNMDPVQFYSRILSQAIVQPEITNHLRYFDESERIVSNMIIRLSDDDLLNYFFAAMREEIMKQSDPDIRNFQLAQAYKNTGSLLAYRIGMRAGNGSMQIANDHFEQALVHYRRVSPAWLNQEITVPGTFDSERSAVPRRYLFQFPDYRVDYHTAAARSLNVLYSSPQFVIYLLENGVFDEVYEDQESLRFFESWLLSYNGAMVSRDVSNRDLIPYEQLKIITEKLEERQAEQVADLNLLYIYLSVAAFNAGDSEIGIVSLRRVRTDRLLNSFQYTLPFFFNTQSLEMVAIAVSHLAEQNEFDLAYNLVNVFRNVVNRSNLYAYASQQVSLRNGSEDAAARLIDSARVEMGRLDNPSAFQPNRPNVASALMFLDTQLNRNESYQIIRNSNQKIRAISNFSLAEAKDQNLYRALQHIPDLISSSDRGFMLRDAITGYHLNEELPAGWEMYSQNEFWAIRRFLPYIREGS